jgi:hypothetical protein
MAPFMISAPDPYDDWFDNEARTLDGDVNLRLRYAGRCVLTGRGRDTWNSSFCGPTNVMNAEFLASNFSALPVVSKQSTRNRYFPGFGAFFGFMLTMNSKVAGSSTN